MATAWGRWGSVDVDEPSRPPPRARRSASSEARHRLRLDALARGSAQGTPTRRPRGAAGERGGEVGDRPRRRSSRRAGRGRRGRREARATSSTVRASGPDLVERRGEGDEAVAADAAVGGLEARRRRRRPRAGGSSRRCRCRARAAPCRAATAAAEPPEEPPGTRAGSHGLRVGLNALFSVDEPIANSSMFVLPSTIAPAASSRVDGGGGEGRAVALEDPRAAGGGEALDVQDVLDRDGHAGERRGAARRRPGRRRARRARVERALGERRRGRRRARARRPRCGRGGRASTSSQETSRARDAAPDLRGGQAARGRSSADHPRARGRGPRPRPGAGAEGRLAGEAGARRRPRAGRRRAGGVAHRRHARGVEGLERLGPGEDLVELAGEERAAPRR